MKILSPRSASEAKNISNFCTDPKGAYLRMLSCLKSAEMYVSKIVVRNMFNKLITCRIGTEEVEHTAKRVVGSSMGGKHQKEVVRIMNLRKRGIEKGIKILQYKWFREKALVKQYLTTERVRRMYQLVEKNHKQFVWEKKVVACKKKVTFLKTKRAKKFQEQMRNTNNWYKVTDQELEQELPLPVGNNFEVYGDVELSEPEKQCLALGPKFMLTPKLNDEDYEVEVELECVKQRMELKKREEAADENGVVNEEDLERAGREWKESREVYEEDTGVLDMSKMAVTDTKYNIRSHPKRAATVENEVLIQAKRQTMMGAYNEIKNSQCDKSGRQKIKNTNESQQEGMRRLNERIKQGEIVVTMTDKSGKFAAVDAREYKKAAKVHLLDEEITNDEMATKEVLFNRHTLQIVKALRMGTVHGKQLRNR